MNPSLTAHLRLTDRLSREWYVFKVEFLAQDVPSGYRKERRRELRSDLTAAAADVGMTQAVRDLGPASVLAHQLKLAEGRKLPHVWTGMITFTVILYAWAGMMMATTYALLEPCHPAGRRPGRDRPRLLGRHKCCRHERSASPIRSVGGLGPHASRPYRGTPACGPHLAIPPSLATAATSKQNRNGT